MLLGVPVLIAIAVFAPALWVWSAAWLTGVLALLLVDAMLAKPLRAYRPKVSAPALLFSGSQDPATITLQFNKLSLPDKMDVQLETNEFLEDVAAETINGLSGQAWAFDVTLKPMRRGTARLERLWSRWRGPLGLIQKRHALFLGTVIPVTPDIRSVKEEAIRLFSRDAEFGIKSQMERGDGSEFDALREFTRGMDRRAIDWKHSARHNVLLAKEFRTERNHNIVFAFDTGRLMSEPLRGVPKLDRAINAALLLTYVSLRQGDRAMIYGFDARPGAITGFLTGTRAFPKAQRIASEFDYSPEETNFTLALSTLSNALQRRSLIIIFSDFVDTISAELMLDNVRRLTDRHLVIFATFEDEALSALTDAPPETPNDVARAVVADTLLTERELVFRRLQRLGVQIIETTPEKFGAELVSKYLHIKRREML